MAKVINVTDITEYLYCPRKVYLRLIKGIRSPPTRPMILGMLRHNVFDIFSKNESALVSSIKERISESQIKYLYDNLLREIVDEIYQHNYSLASKFDILHKDFIKSVSESMTPEISLRVGVIKKTIDSGFLGKELWRNLKPKYLTEYKLESPEIGLRGRIDRIRFAEDILPFEIKTRENVYESDKIQLAAYALLLEQEFGKPIAQGIIEFRGNQQQVELTEELKNQVLVLADKIRNMTQGEMPSNFSKCKNCQLREQCEEAE